MAEIRIQDIDSNTLHKLEILAKQHGRSLQAEIKHILESVAQDYPSSSLGETEIIYQKVVQMQKQLEAYYKESVSSETEPINSPLNLIATLERLKTLKRTISSLQGLSIREAIEEGRRF